MFADDTTWPPKALASISPTLAEWSAWYAGDPEALTDVYSRQVGNTAYRVRPSQLAGGLVGAVSRFFWGQPRTPGQPRRKLHVPAASDIATASADLLFGEEIRLDFGGLKGDRLAQILDGNSWQALLPEAGEVCAALGGVYLRATWDQDVAGFPLITTMHADGALPEFRYGRLSAVTFWQQVATDGQTVLRHLERHEPGRIVHELRQGTPGTLGRPVPLAEAPETAALPVDADSAIVTGIPKLTVAYVPNMRPQRRWRTDPLGRNLGRADIDQTEPLLDALDEAWTSWMRDLRHGKSRVFVPDSMLANMGPGQGATFDLDQEIFTGLRTLGDPNAALGQQISPQQFAIRVDEHERTCRALLTQIVQGAGYSAQTFGLQDEVAATATEVGARERRTATTREKKSRYWTATLEDFLETVTMLDRSIFSQGEVIRPDVEFPPSSTPTLTEMAQSLNLINQAQAASIDTRVRMLHPEWDEKRILDEVQAIKDESSVGSVGAISVGVDPATIGATSQDAQDLKAKFDALGVAVRSGVNPENAAEQLGLNVNFTGAVPVSLRLPTTDASGLEQQ